MFGSTFLFPFPPSFPGLLSSPFLNPPPPSLTCNPPIFSVPLPPPLSPVPFLVPFPSFWKKLPDCIIGSEAIKHWQQFFASSHFFLEYVEVEKRSQAAAAATAAVANAGGAAGASSGAGGGGGNASTSSAVVDSGSGAEGAGGGAGGGGIGSAPGSTAKSAGGGDVSVSRFFLSAARGDGICVWPRPAVYRMLIDIYIPVQEMCVPFLSATVCCGHVNADASARNIFAFPLPVKCISARVYSCRVP